MEMTMIPAMWAVVRAVLGVACQSRVRRSLALRSVAAPRSAGPGQGIISLLIVGGRKSEN